MILETSFIIDLLLGDARAIRKAKELSERGEVIRLPAPAIFELWEGVERSEQSDAEAAKVREFSAAYEALPFEESHAIEAGRLSGRLGKKGPTAGTVDVQIAGMAKVRSEAVVTADETLLGLTDEIQVERYR